MDDLTITGRPLSTDNGQLPKVTQVVEEVTQTEEEKEQKSEYEKQQERREARAEERREKELFYQSLPTKQLIDMLEAAQGEIFPAPTRIQAYERVLAMVENIPNN